MAWHHAMVRDQLLPCQYDDTLTFQRFIAAEKPPHLKAIAPWEGAGDFYRQTLCRGGIPNPAFWARLSTTMQGLLWALR